jgi:hypothetical protein
LSRSWGLNALFPGCGPCLPNCRPLSLPFVYHLEFLLRILIQSRIPIDFVRDKAVWAGWHLRLAGSTVRCGLIRWLRISAARGLIALLCRCVGLTGVARLPILLAILLPILLAIIRLSILLPIARLAIGLTVLLAVPGLGGSAVRLTIIRLPILLPITILRRTIRLTVAGLRLAVAAIPLGLRRIVILTEGRASHTQHHY